MNKKSVLILLGIIIVIVILIIAITSGKNDEEVTAGVATENQVKEEFAQTLTDGTRLNTSTKMQETKTIDGMEITGIQLTEKNNVSVLLGTVTNKSGEKKGGYPVSITILDKQAKEIITVGGYIEELEPEESTQLNVSATFDYANAYDYKIEKLEAGD